MPEKLNVLPFVDTESVIKNPSVAVPVYIRAGRRMETDAAPLFILIEASPFKVYPAPREYRAIAAVGINSSMDVSSVKILDVPTVRRVVIPVRVSTELPLIVKEELLLNVKLLNAFVLFI